MTTFFSTELDFIFFFYGLAFMLLGAVCFGSTGSGGRDNGWVALGLFGYAHGALEWMELFALIVGDDSYFATVRLACLTASFLFLMEFARAEWTRLGRGPPDRSLFGLLAFLVVAVGLSAGLPAANAVTRYAIGFLSALAAAWGLARRAETLSAVPAAFHVAIVARTLRGRGSALRSTPRGADDEAQARGRDLDHGRRRARLLSAQHVELAAPTARWRSAPRRSSGRRSSVSTSRRWDM